MKTSALAQAAMNSALSPAHGLWNRLAPRCQQPGCTGNHPFWRRMRRRRRQIVVAGLRCCLDCCFEPALADALSQVSRAPARATVRHRIPIGLLLVSRQQLSGAQLRTALEAQQAAGHGRIGEWLQNLGYASEAQVTAALARQWSCPVLRGETLGMPSPSAPHIPWSLMRWLAMAPVDFVASTRTLHLAFADGPDYRVLYALEQMLDCRTEPCLVRPSILRRHFEQLAEARQESEVLFERIADIAEFIRIIRSYAIRLGAAEVRLGGCGAHVWVRLLGGSRHPLDLTVREVRESSSIPYRGTPGLTAAAV